MSLKALAKGVAKEVGRIGVVRRSLTSAYVWWSKDSHVGNLPHPYDLEMGIDASGALPRYLIQSGTPADDKNMGYLGVVPSILRTALNAIDNLAEFGLVDLGCGKGRALAVASEFPFRRIVGIELSSDLCEVAVRNAAIVRAKFPARTPIEIVQGDASAPGLPNSPVVVLFVHSFEKDLVTRLADNLATAAEKQEVIFLYINPVHGVVFDQHPAFTRSYAEQLTVAPEEVPFCQGVSSAVAAWRAGPSSSPSRYSKTSQSNPDKEIVILDPEYLAEIR